MDSREIYTKTEAGREEIRTRALRLSGALRNILLLVDGHRTVAQLKELIAGGKAPPDAIDLLLAQGLIELTVAAPKAAPPASAPAAGARSDSAGPAPAPADAGPAHRSASPAPAATAASPQESDETRRFNRLYNVMNEITRDYLGLRGVFMQLKIEKCASAEELLELQEELGAAIAKAHNRAVSAELIARIQAAA